MGESGITIRLVAQKDKTGCGLACIAAVTNQTYDAVKSKARNLFGWTKRKNDFSLKVNELDRLLKELSVTSDRTKFSGWKEFSGLAIVGVKIHNLEPDRHIHHWVVAFKNSNKLMIMDPRYGEIYDGNHKKRRKHVKERKGTTYFPISNSRVKSVTVIVN